ncbi:MAG: D-sedoheptulose 7-phosphate isomerase [Candidatus Omnitrophota bacterium]
MEKMIKEIIQDSITTKALLLYDEDIIKKIRACADIITKTLKKGGKVLIFGNGGSAADSQHFAAELVGRFQKERKALAAISLTTDTSILTSLSNDYSFDIVFARQIEAYGGPRDLAFAISTSGKAKNVIRGVKEAKKLKIKTIGLTGKNGGELAKIADLSIVIPSFVTARIQESHILIIHIICELVEESWTKK